MKDIAGCIQDFLKTWEATTLATSADPLACAIVLLSDHKMLTDDDQLELADYLAANRSQAVIFSNFPETTRTAWLNKTLCKLKSNSQSNHASHHGDKDVEMV